MLKSFKYKLKGTTLTLACVCSNPTGPAIDESVRTNRTDEYKYHSEKGWYFFVCKNIIQEGMVFKMKIIKEELQFEESLKQRLEFICEFSKVTPKFINGSIRKIEMSL